ncbi:MAG: OmcA/MtrC family decaheme c-type cytochrome [Rhodoferax sp.]|uniref:OmcA/MtrC family decaheme c-type cytochrome n=1 Tax=Rhodoferax sp. TaxID=50421 RepID=UPI0026244E2A|nr:OmcA/MtrC family decaheme c-type cytochrome [Rhodoferax sp.]MDD2882042.1 OmcA/MtrC family decaheme c-type cytochrome [Rhodoferax sp.]
MKSSIFRWGTALMASLVIVGCGGGGGGTAVVIQPPTGTSVNAAITTAAATAVNDTATNPTAAFTVLQAAGVPAVTINSPPVVNFTVFSDGAVKTGLVLSNVRFALAKLVPGTNGNPDEWKSYISVSKTAAAGIGPGGAASPRAVAKQATTDGSMSLEEVAAANLVGQLTYNPDGYYSYAFKTDIKDITKTSGVTYEPSLTHRVAIQLSYKNAAGATVLVNPYFDFTIVDGKAVQVAASKTRKMADVASCNSCHEKLALHGGGRVDTQYCVMCHNPGTVDPESGNSLDMASMTHSIHAGRRIKASTGDDYTIWGYGNAKHDYAEVGFPQDLRNCTKCHSGANPATPQGDNWKTAVSTKACLTCHTPKAGGAWETTHKVYAGTLVGAGAAASSLTNAQCVTCHKAGSNISPEVVHWNQNEENSAKYKMNIESATYDAATRKVTVKYFLADTTNGNAAHNLVTTDCTAGPTCATTTKFGNLRFYVAYQSMVGQTTAVTDFSSYNNGGSGANQYAYKGTNDGTNHYTVDIALPADTATSVATGTARVLSIGQVKEPQLILKSIDPRPAVVPAALVNVVVQNTHKDVVLTGVMNPRRQVVSNDKCNACHGSLGSTSGSNTLAEAFHSGARNTVEACSLCHDANRASSTVMTNGLAMNESYQFNRMIHGIHGNSKRVSPFTHGNKVVAAFCNPTGTTVAAIDLCKTNAPLGIVAGLENYAAEVAYPGVGLNCNACHVNNSYKNDQGTLGAVVLKGPATVSAAGALTVTADTNPSNWLVISPKAASCTACHDSSAAIGHVTAFGGSSFGNLKQGAVAGLTGSAAAPRETCNDCHASGGFKGVDIVHGQQ